MGNENYMNHYVEILTSTMQDVIVRNISLQANAKISENIIGDQMKKNEDLILKVNNLSDEIKKTKEFNLQSESEKVKNLENTVNGMSHIHISEPTRLRRRSYAVCSVQKKKIVVNIMSLVDDIIN